MRPEPLIAKMIRSPFRMWALWIRSASATKCVVEAVLPAVCD